MTSNDFIKSVETKAESIIEVFRQEDVNNEIDFSLLYKQEREALNMANQMTKLTNCHQGQLQIANKILMDSKSIGEMKFKINCCHYIIEKGYSLQKMLSRVLRNKTNWEHISCFREMIEVREKLGYKKVRYPEGLDNLYKEKDKFDYRLTQDLYSSDKIEKRYEENKWMNREITVNNKTYIFMIPKTMNDIRKEAKQLHTCIATRSEEYADGDLIYILIHKKTSPNNAYAHIMINKNGVILWAVTKNYGKLTDDATEAFVEFMHQTKNAGTLSK